MKTAVTALCIVGALVVLTSIEAIGIKMLFVVGLVAGILLIDSGV